MSVQPFNSLLPSQHSYGASPNPGAVELMRVAQLRKLQTVEIPGAHLLKIGGDFPGPEALLQGTQIKAQQQVQVPGAHLLKIGGDFPGPQALIDGTRSRKLQTIEIPGAKPPDVAGPFPGPEALIQGTDPVRPHHITVPGVQMGYKPPDSYLSLMAYLSNLHISLAAAPPGRESAPPSPRQAAIDAYTGR